MDGNIGKEILKLVAIIPGSRLAFRLKLTVKLCFESTLFLVRHIV